MHIKKYLAILFHISENETGNSVENSSEVVQFNAISHLDFFLHEYFALKVFLENCPLYNINRILVSINIISITWK